MRDVLVGPPILCHSRTGVRSDGRTDDDHRREACRRDQEVGKDVLTLETTYSDSDFKIEWDQIASIESDRQFLIETFDGKRLSGSVKSRCSPTRDFMNSDEQGLDLPTTIGGGGGRYLFRSASQYLAVGSGLAWTNENYSDPATPPKPWFFGVVGLV